MFTGASRFAFTLALSTCAITLGAQTPSTSPARPTPPRRAAVPMDSARAAQLYVSSKHEDLPKGDYARQMAAKKVTDSTYAARSAGVMEFRKVVYQSRADGRDVPAGPGHGSGL